MIFPNAHAPLRLRKTPKRPPLSIDQILSWADDWFAAHGRWPNVNSGLVPGTIDDTWARIDNSLRNGYRSLPERPKLSQNQPRIGRIRRVKTSQVVVRE